MLPTYLHNGYGFSGQSGGVLGAKHDPWHIKADPNSPDFRVEELSLPPGLTANRLDDRQGLLARIDAQAESLARAADGDDGGDPRRAGPRRKRGRRDGHADNRAAHDDNRAKSDNRSTTYGHYRAIAYSI